MGPTTAARPLQRYDPSYHRGPFDNANPCALRPWNKSELYELSDTGSRAYTRRQLKRSVNVPPPSMG